MSPLFGSLSRLEGAMSFLRERNAVLASNVANVETPGFRPSDLLAPEDGAFDATMAAAEVVTSDDREPGVDGNTVSLEAEMAKLSENRVRFAATASVTSRRLALLRYAAGDGT
jgi:flagellar basal-body rod protein FlgB